MLPSNFRYTSSEKDDLIWRKLEEDSDAWCESVSISETYREVGSFMSKYKDTKAELMHTVVKGGYNVVYRLEFQDGTSLIMRVPIKGVIAFPDEKVLSEVATMRYVAANTTIPVPRIHHYGTAAENPTGLGPFIIMDYIEHYHNMSRVLLDPKLPIDERPVLDPDIGQEKLELLYGQMANILLQLSSLKFPCVGSLALDGDPGSVERRPLAMNMNQLLIHTNMPARILPPRAYSTAREWYGALVDMHMAQLALQYNDTAEDDDDDVRDKYTARKLFRRLVDADHLWPDRNGPGGEFRLFSEDLRPANVLVDEHLRVVSVIDWEFAYAAPAEFTDDPPAWLLLIDPEGWPGEYTEWMEAYEPRLRTFLRVLEAEEAKMAEADGGSPRGNDGGSPPPPLSQRMRRSWEARDWMLNYAARDSWAFDFVWWKFLDERYFGPNEDQDHRARVHLLTAPQREAMGALVAAKAEERSQRRIFEWDEGLAVARLNGLLAY